MKLPYFTDEAYSRLLKDVDKNTEKYLSDENWIPEYFKGEEYYKVSSIQVDDFELLPPNNDNGENAFEDIENTRRVYEAFKNLTPAQAIMGKTMWSYLCHVTYRDYIRRRYFEHLGPNTIAHKCFFIRQDYSFILNGLAKLWWCGYCTYDPSEPNRPYHLTEILLHTPSVFNYMMFSLNRHNFNRMKGVLLGVKDHITSCGEDGLSTSVRECRDYLNRQAAVLNFDALPYEKIRKMTREFMLKIYQNRITEK